MNKKYCISLDVGGTSIKSAIVSSDGKIIDHSISLIPIDSKGTSEKIIRTFVKPMSSLFQLAQSQKISIAGIGIGMPGPFDYENGISLIKGVDKYESIYGINLKDEFRNHLKLAADYPILFEIDAWSFVRGEAWQGAGNGFNRIIGLTIGTGLGSGFMINDEMVDTGAGVPKFGWIGGLKYKDGILDDQVSRRGIISKYLKLSGSQLKNIDVKEIAEKAETGDVHAAKTFEETGTILGQMLKPVAEIFQAECIIIGGQVAKSYHLFAPALKNEFQSAIKITQAKNIEQSALLGVSRFLFKNII